MNFSVLTFITKYLIKEAINLEKNTLYKSKVSSSIF